MKRFQLSLRGTPISVSKKNLFSSLLIASVVSVTSCKKDIAESPDSNLITSASIDSVIVSGQVSDQTTFPLNDYLTTPSDNPYPIVNNNKINAIDHSKFKNVMDYGAKGDGKTLDDNAIVSAFKAAQSANTGVLFPSGKTFMVSKTSSISLNKNMTVWAYGATIKMAAFKRYSAFAFPYPDGSRKNTFIWLGGTIDGNKNNQSWPGSPTGKTAWEEDHGQMLRVLNAGFVLFKDVTLTNSVVDGITFSKCRIAVISDCNANNGAPLRYSEVKEQGTYFKVRQGGGTREGTAFYVNNTKCSGGSIGIHYSTNNVEDSSVTVLNNVEISNGAQDAIHFEHSRRNFMYDCYIWRDPDTKIYKGQRVRKYSADIHVSNNTLIASIKKCRFQDARVDARNSSDMKLGVIDGCTFTNTVPGVCVDGTQGFSHIINSTFKGKANSFQARGNYAMNNTFQDFGSRPALASAMNVYNSTFSNGSTQPISLLKNGMIYQCTFNNCPSQKNSTPSTDGWKNNFRSYINIVSDTKKQLGRITCGITN